MLLTPESHPFMHLSINLTAVGPGLTAWQIGLGCTAMAQEAELTRCPLHRAASSGTSPHGLHCVLATFARQMCEDIRRPMQDWSLPTIGIHLPRLLWPSLHAWVCSCVCLHAIDNAHRSLHVLWLFQQAMFAGGTSMRRNG